MINDTILKEEKETVKETETKTKTNEDEMVTGTPVSFLRSLMPPNFDATRCAFFQDPDEDQLDAYNFTTVRAVREKDLVKLRELLKEGQNFNACNRNGETLLHLACRRGDVETVEFLVREAGVPTEARDSLGRTVFHDACWRPEPDFPLMDCLIGVVSPLLLIAEDRRGHSPFDYSRQENWPAWNVFLSKRKDLIKRRMALAA
jgi:hypothetical protein